MKRLKEERVGYDNQLAAIERSLKGKEHDFEELLLLGSPYLYLSPRRDARQGARHCRTQEVRTQEGRSLGTQEELLGKEEKRD